MATVKRRGAVSNYLKKAQMYLHHRYEISQLEKPRNNEKKWLRQFLAENGVIDPETGNIQATFAKPLDVYGQHVYGMELRKIPGAESFNRDEVAVFLRQKGLYGKVFREVTTEVFDQDELYVLQQEGKISEDKLRSLIHTADPTYQLWPIDKPPLADD